MMKSFVFCAVMTLCVSSLSWAQGRGFGLGVILGEPTGISAKGWVSSRGAVDAGLAWSFRHRGFLHAHADYLWHFHDVVNSRHRVLPYLGIGGRLLGRNNDSAVAGVRIVGGFSWLPVDVPLDVFLEIAPIVDLAPETETSLNGGVGVRFYFR
jgi:hypothetical protein